MARIRKFTAYRRLERPFTRHSKYNKLSFVRARPVCRVVRFDMGNQNEDFTHVIKLIAKDDLQIRDHAIESARLTANRYIEKYIGKKTGFFMRCHAYPHHILRENPLASGAGADRLSTGMKMSFGKTIGRAAQVTKGKVIFSVKTHKQHVPVARTAIARCVHKLPCSYQVIVEELKAKA